MRRSFSIASAPPGLSQVVPAVRKVEALVGEQEVGDLAAAHREGERVVARVRDDGAGIPKHLLEDVFELFVQSQRTLDRSEGGLGVGLTLVRGLVLQHGGTVTAHSEGEGKGSEFVVSLPAVPDGTLPDAEPQATSEPEAEASPRTNPKGMRVVVVEDSLIRGTTFRKQAKILRDAGAKEVHLRITCPPTLHACYYGIDFPSSDQLIASRLKSVDAIAEWLGVNSLGYLSVEGLLAAVSKPSNHYCTACWTGKYPLPPVDAMNKLGLERS